ncbi:MAG: DNA gyrase subunit A [Bacilli bacterium]|jgi:DNA gyrase subunit A
MFVDNHDQFDPKNPKLNPDQTEEEIDLDEVERIESGIVPGLKDVDIATEVRGAFLDYAMSVIVARAIPDVRDGFKPVHRRIIHSMNESGMTPDKPHKKSARIVGDVMGKYHPHGDAAIYSTLVRLAQPFSMRYPLVDGHGNFGSIDGDEAAAMRYTEARMSKIVLEMVRDIDLNTVDFTENYDGSEKEPVVLPSRFPNLLVNGTSGIAVGMATNMAPHNLKEVINAIVAIAHDPELTPLEIMQNYLFGPDFPTGGLILGRAGIRKAYETGQGSVIMRAKTHIEPLDNGKNRIVVTEVPYQVNKARVIETIADLVRNKVIEGITDIRDESNSEGIRVVIELRKDIIPEVMLNQLYKNTQLQNSFGIINLCLVNNSPKVLPITELLKNYLEHQIEIIQKRTEHQLQVAEARHHIVQGLLRAREHIDEIVDIIKDSATPDEASNRLIERFEFSDLQVREILNMTLRRLTGLEEQRLENERLNLEASIANYRRILSSRENIQEVVLNELEEIKNRYGDERRTVISNDYADIDDEDLIPEEEIIVSLTKNGYIKRLSPDTFKTQHRGGRGIRGMQTNEDDVVDLLIHTKTHTDVLFFTNRGVVYRLRGYKIPEQSRTAKGIPVQNLLNLEQEEKVRAMMSIDEYSEDEYLFFVTVNGTVKRTRLSEFESIRTNGKIAISLVEGDQLLDVKHTDGNCLIGIGSNHGKMVKFAEEDVRPMGRTARGVRGITLEKGGKAVGATTSNEGNLMLVLTDKGYGKMTKADEYRLTKRGAKGVITINATKKNGELVGLKAVNGDEDVLIITSAGIVIRISLTQVRVMSRNTQGVRLIRLDEGQEVSSFATVNPSDEEEVIE